MSLDLFKKWFAVDGGQTLLILLSVACIYMAVILYTRITGLVSLSKMSASDFAMTVAVGSLFGAAIASPSPTVGMAAVALAGLYVGQWGVAFLRARSSVVCNLLDNDPVLLMIDGQPIHDAMRRANVSEDDLRAKLREANVLRYEQVRAVVFETTGDVSVLHADDDTRLAPDLLRDVRGAERYHRLDDSVTNRFEETRS